MSDAIRAAKEIAGNGRPQGTEPPCEHAEFRERRPCHGHHWKCHNDDSPLSGLISRGEFCRSRCKHRVEPGGEEPPETTTVTKPDDAILPSLSMIFTIYDEDPDEVTATLESAAAAYPNERLELVIIDDGGDRCSGAVNAADTGGVRIEYRRNEQNKGVGRARNQAVEMASGEVLSFHDAHMRFPPYGEMKRAAAEHDNDLDIPEGWSSTMMLADSAWIDGCIVSSASRDTRKDRGFWASGADLFWNRRDGLQPKWQMPNKWDVEFKRVACIMGAGYFMSRTTAEVLTEATGQLWEDTAGLWGMSEQALSVKAFLLDIPVFATRDIFTRHLYRSTNPVEGAGKEVWKNLTRCASRLFPPDMFEARFLPYCRKRLGDDVETYRAEYAGLADRVRTAKVFTHLVGKGAPVAERHPDHEWLDEVNEACSTLADARVLMWRPGEALFSVLDFAPESDITVIAAPGPRADNWWDICRENGIDIVKARLDDDYVERPVNDDSGPFDLVLINGPLQEECLKNAKRVLAEGGRIVRNERADRGQLEDDEKRQEKKDIEAALEKRDDEARREDSAESSLAQTDTATNSPGSAELTVLLLNWRRPENLDEILDALAAQTVEPRVWLWDNSGEFDEDPRVDRAVSADANWGCAPRWWLAAAAETEYVCSLDDDLKPTDAEVMEDMMHACMAREVPGIVGPYGWRGRGRFMPGGSPPYKGGQHIGAGSENVAVDLVKGRCMMLPRRLLRRVPLSPPLPDDADINRAELLARCDDIYVNIMASRGRAERHLVPRVVEGRFEDVGGQDGRALATDSGHYETRERAIEALLEYWEGRDE